jgi:hypothetical protein
MVAPPVDDGSEAELRALEREWMEAWRRRDRATCERLLAPDFLLTSARGVLIPRLDWLENAMGAFVCEAFEWLELRVRLLTPDVALVHARAQQRARVAEHDWSGVFLLTDTWVRRAGQWQVVSRHGTGPLPTL